jgi:hypothetical protein
MATSKIPFTKAQPAVDDTDAHTERAYDLNLTQSLAQGKHSPPEGLSRDPGAHGAGKPGFLKPLHVAALVASISLSAVAQAQTAPSAGALLQQIEQGRTISLPKVQPLERAPAPPEMKAVTGAVVLVKAFRFAGNHLLRDDQLALAVMPFLDRPLGFAELQEAAVAVARLIGWRAGSCGPICRTRRSSRGW